MINVMFYGQIELLSFDIQLNIDETIQMFIINIEIAAGSFVRL